MRKINHVKYLYVTKFYAKIDKSLKLLKATTFNSR